MASPKSKTAATENPIIDPSPLTDYVNGIQQVPDLTEITVTFKTTVPTQQFGNLEFFVSQKVMADNNVTARQTAITDTLNELKAAVVQVMLPLVEAEVERAKPALIKEANPDNWMQLKNPVYRWLRVASPYTPIEAMENLLQARLANRTE